MTAAVVRTLSATRRRLFAQRLINQLAWVIPIVFCAALMLPARLSVICLLLIVFAAGLGELLRRQNAFQIASWLDARADARDRFTTALDFAARPNPTAFERSALEECEAFARHFCVERWTPLRLPRFAAWLIAPLLAIAFFAWRPIFTPAVKPTASQLAVRQQADALQQIAQALRAAGSGELARAAAQMDESARRMRADAAKADAVKTALRETSSLEAMLRGIQSAHDHPVSPKELAALAEALAADQRSRPAADSLHSGQLNAAAAQLDALGREMSGTTSAQLAASMQEQTAQLTEAQKNEIGREMQADAARGVTSSALQRIAQLLQQAARNGLPSRPAPGRRASNREIQDLLTELADLKAGLRSGTPKKDAGSSAIAAALPPSGDKGAAASGNPSGQPGGERDPGHSENLFAPQPITETSKTPAPAAQLQGDPGEGESMEQFLAAAGDRSGATREYRENYQRLAPAEQNAVEQEDIPLGARAFVRRYFENIRPTE